MASLEDYVKLDGKTCNDCLINYEEFKDPCRFCLRNPMFHDHFDIDLDKHFQRKQKELEHSNNSQEPCEEHKFLNCILCRC